MIIVNLGVPGVLVNEEEIQLRERLAENREIGVAGVRVGKQAITGAACRMEEGGKAS